MTARAITNYVAALIRPAFLEGGQLKKQPTITIMSAHVSLTLWIIHPRKGASRGCEVEVIERDDLPGVFSFLREAAKRNADRFSKIPA